MDHRLAAWARAVKARRRGVGPHLPPLWVFTDPARMPDPCAVVRRLPPGLCGVVFRHDRVAGRAELGRLVAQACRRRSVPLVVAGDARLALRVRAGVHLRAGRWPGLPVRHRGWRTSSAHGRADAVRAMRAGAQAVFLSPVFPTRSHPGAASLSPLRWGLAVPRKQAFAQMFARMFALGGLDGRRAKRLPRWCAGVGAIEAFGGGKGQV